MYIYQWNDDDIQVKPSCFSTEEEVWAFAIKWLRPAGMKDDKEAEKLIRSEGTVVPCPK